MGAGSIAVCEQYTALRNKCMESCAADCDSKREQAEQLARPAAAAAATVAAQQVRNRGLFADAAHEHGHGHRRRRAAGHHSAPAGCIKHVTKQQIASTYHIVQLSLSFPGPLHRVHYCLLVALVKEGLDGDSSLPHNATRLMLVHPGQGAIRAFLLRLNGRSLVPDSVLAAAAAAASLSLLVLPEAYRGLHVQCHLRGVQQCWPASQPAVEKLARLWQVVLAETVCRKHAPCWGLTTGCVQRAWLLTMPASDLASSDPIYSDLEQRLMPTLSILRQAPLKVLLGSTALP